MKERFKQSNQKTSRVIEKEIQKKYKVCISCNNSFDNKLEICPYCGVRNK